MVSVTAVAPVRGAELLVAAASDLASVERTPAEPERLVPWYLATAAAEALSRSNVLTIHGDSGCNCG